MINFLINYYSLYTFLRVLATGFVLVQLITLLSFIYYEFKFGFPISSSIGGDSSSDLEESKSNNMIFSLKERKKKFYHNSVLLMILFTFLCGIIDWLAFVCVCLIFLLDTFPLTGTGTVVDMIMDFVVSPVQFLADEGIVDEYTDINGVKRKLCLPYIVTMGYIYIIAPLISFVTFNLVVFYRVLQRM